MPPLIERLSAGGPLIQVAVGIDPVRAAAEAAIGSPPILPELCLALIDTGASMSLVDEKLALVLGLVATDRGMVRSAGGVRLHPRYEISFSFTLPRTWTVPGAIGAIGADVFPFDVQFILGRDLLRYCRFGYDGPAGSFTLDY